MPMNVFNASLFSQNFLVTSLTFSSKVSKLACMADLGSVAPPASSPSGPSAGGGAACFGACLSFWALASLKDLYIGNQEMSSFSNNSRMNDSVPLRSVLGMAFRWMMKFTYYHKS